MGSRYLVYYEGVEGNYVTCQLVYWHWLAVEEDILGIIGMSGSEIPKWLELAVNLLLEMENSPSPTPSNPAGLPSLGEFLELISNYRTLQQGIPLPAFPDLSVGGLVISPGGTPEYINIPFTCNLMHAEFLGLAAWVQSGLVSLSGSLVSRARLTYRRATLPPRIRPGIALDIMEHIGMYTDTSGWSTLNFYRYDFSGYEACAEAETLANKNILSHAGWPDDILWDLDPFFPWPNDPGGGGEQPDWHFMYGQYPFEVVAYSRPDGTFQYIFQHFDSGITEGDEYPCAFNAPYPDTTWLADLGWEKYWYGEEGGKIRRNYGYLECQMPGLISEGNEMLVIPDWLPWGVGGLGLPVSLVSPAFGLKIGEGKL